MIILVVFLYKKTEPMLLRLNSGKYLLFEKF